MFALLTGLVLTAVAVLLLGYLVALVFGAARLPLAEAGEKRRLARHLELARASDRAIAAGDRDAALAAIRDAFYLHPIRRQELVTTIANHHTALLSRLLALASDAAGDSVRLLSLAKTDRLLHERAGLQRSALAARQGGRRERRTELDAALARNSEELRRLLQSLLEEVRATQRPQRSH